MRRRDCASCAAGRCRCPGSRHREVGGNRSINGSSVRGAELPLPAGGAPRITVTGLDQKGQWGRASTIEPRGAGSQTARALCLRKTRGRWAGEMSLFREFSADAAGSRTGVRARENHQRRVFDPIVKRHRQRLFWSNGGFSTGANRLPDHDGGAGATRDESWSSPVLADVAAGWAGSLYQRTQPRLRGCTRTADARTVPARVVPSVCAAPASHLDPLAYDGVATEGGAARSRNHGGHAQVARRSGELHARRDGNCLASRLVRG